MAAANILEVVIGRIGAQGDGIAAMPDGKPLYVPQAATGDHVRVAIEGPESDGIRGRLLDVIEAGPARGTPPCRHFGVCGGCALQHLSPATYRDWKRRLLTDALARNGVQAGTIADLAMVGINTRRRGTFFAEKTCGIVKAGFHERGSHRISAVDGCVILLPELIALVEQLPSAMAELLGEGERAEIVANRLDSGIDVLVRLPREADHATRERLVRFANDADLARISVVKSDGRNRSVKPDPVVARRTAFALFGGVRVVVPPGAFLQASADAEALLVAEAKAGIEGAANVADLFAGAGTFAFAFAKNARVHAAESDPDLIEALKLAAAKAGLGPRMTAETRDLFRRPLLADELKRFDAVVFDPPRVGAKAQAEALAKSQVARVVAVSCNPQSFARDARILQDGGYRLMRAVPVDQFLWTHHLEVVGTFVR